MTLDDLTVNFEHLNRETILEDWEWLIGKRKQPILLAASGDAFLQDIENGTVHILDVAANQVGLVAESIDKFFIVPTLRVGTQPRTLQRPKPTNSLWAEVVTPSLNPNKRIS
ncbi:hypothetical protein J0667_07000 [Methylomonas sp. WH-1]|uniref:hypothetical protein n=1 Tax=unclassified Methylomonas TaxID=2608980 RepID=UPI0010223988|nr:hypothetical protein [Methylomonas sp. LW13]